MEVKIISKSVPKEFEATFRNEIENIPLVIKQMLNEKNITFTIVDYINDLLDEKKLEKIKNNYKYDYNTKQQSRGIMSDDINCIAVSVKNTRIEDIGAILYHEIGHFLDGYQNFGKIDDLGLTFSIDEKFIKAYTKDFIENYELIKNDKNFRLKHFVQDSTPENINKSAIIETFAELFRLANNKKNDTKTVELYFLTAFNVLKLMLNENFNLGI